MTLPVTPIEKMIADCEICKQDLSAWEREFVANVRAMYGRGKKLSEKQLEVLRRIWEKKT